MPWLSKVSSQHLWSIPSDFLQYWSKRLARNLLVPLVKEQYDNMHFTRSADKNRQSGVRQKIAWMQIRLNIYKALTPQAFPYCGRWNYERKTLTQTCAGKRILWDVQLVFCSWSDFYWINQRQWMSQTQKNGFQYKQTSSVCFKVARGKLWEMFGDLNLGDFKCKALFSCAENGFVHGLIPTIFWFFQWAHTCRCHQWSNRPHNKFSHCENSSFGSFTSDVLCRSACRHRLYTWFFN